MTTIVALHEPKVGTFIGADSQISFGTGKMVNCVKWARRKNVAIGVAGIARIGYLVQHYIDQLLDTQSVFDFNMSMLTMLKQNDFEAESDEGSPCYHCDVLYVTGRKIYSMINDMTPFEIPARQLASLGSGSSYAIGAGNIDLKAPSEKRIKDALRLACQFDIYSALPTNLDFIPY